MSTRRLLPLAFLTALSLGSCEKNDAAPDESALLNQRWLLERIDNIPIAASSYSETSRSSLELVALGSGTVGLGPCNNFSGRYTLSGTAQQLSIGPQIATRTSCPALDLETRYLDNLARTARYEISGSELRLYDQSSAEPRLVFRRAAR